MMASPVRTLVVWCPDWSVIAAAARPDHAAAVVFANRVVAVTPAARHDGVRAGQRRREAQARCPDLVVVERDDVRDARLFEQVARVLDHFTPRLEITVPGWLAFPTRGPSRYFGGDEALAAQVCGATDTVLSELGWPSHARVGIADGPFAAARAARQGQPVEVIDEGGSAAFLDPLPVQVLGRPELADVLQRLGIRTLGRFAALEPADVVGRFGADGGLAHRLARGLDERPPATAPPPPDLAVTTAIDPPAERVDTAAFVAKAAADELHRRLDERGMACTRVLIRAETEHGEVLERAWRHEGALHAAAMADRVRWQLDGWLNGSAASRPTAGIAHLTLVPDEVIPAAGRQLGFWGGETAAADRAARAVARVQGMLGPDAVTVPEWRGGRSPSDRIGSVPASAVELTESRVISPPGALDVPWPGQVPAPAPASVHLEPLAAEVRDRQGRPVGVSGRAMLTAAPAELAVDGGPGLPVDAWAGPWPVEERWWDPQAARRRARFQILASGRAHLLSIEGGRWWVEATYD
jgi:protein ImuB